MQSWEFVVGQYQVEIKVCIDLIEYPVRSDGRILFVSYDQDVDEFLQLINIPTTYHTFSLICKNTSFAKCKKCVSLVYQTPFNIHINWDLTGYHIKYAVSQINFLIIKYIAYPYWKVVKKIFVNKFWDVFSILH